MIDFEGIGSVDATAVEGLCELVDELHERGRRHRHRAGQRHRRRPTAARWCDRADRRRQRSRHDQPSRPRLSRRGPATLNRQRAGGAVASPGRTSRARPRSTAPRSAVQIATGAERPFGATIRRPRDRLDDQVGVRWVYAVGHRRWKSSAVRAQWSAASAGRGKPACKGTAQAQAPRSRRPHPAHGGGGPRPLVRYVPWMDGGASTRLAEVTYEGCSGARVRIAALHRGVARAGTRARSGGGEGGRRRGCATPTSTPPGVTGRSSRHRRSFRDTKASGSSSERALA